MPKRIDALDGVRALACLGVIACHRGLPGCGGAWLGVDVFFVLSGYLITQLLLTEQQDTGTIRLGRFWTRRLGRLYPALVALVALCVLTAPLAGHSWSDVGIAAAVALAYVTDLFSWAFGDHAGASLTHTWSLAVEEQFYLLWPLVILWSAGRRRRLSAAALTVGLVSIVAAVVLGGQVVAGELTLYFAPVGRAFELLAGASLAMWQVRLPRPAAPAVAVACGVGLAVLAQFATPLWADGLLAVDLLAAAALSWGLVLAILSGATVGLTAAPLTWLGKRSYGVYLYHVPVLALIDAHLHLRRFLDVIVVTGATILLSAASFRWLETPCRSG